MIVLACRNRPDCQPSSAAGRQPARAAPTWTPRTRNGHWAQCLPGKTLPWCSWHLLVMLWSRVSASSERYSPERQVARVLHITTKRKAAPQQDTYCPPYNGSPVSPAFYIYPHTYILDKYKSYATYMHRPPHRNQRPREAPATHTHTP